MVGLRTKTEGLVMLFGADQLDPSFSFSSKSAPEFT